MTEKTEKKTKSVRAGDPKCILLTATNKAVKKPWEEAFELVTAGKARFISRTEFKAHTLGVKVPANVAKQGDRAVKDFIQSQLKPQKAEKETKPETKSKEKN